MHVWLDTDVTASDGVDVGRVATLVVHPASWRILEVVVRRGALWNRSEVELGLADIQRATPQRTWIGIDSGAFQQLPSASSKRRRPPEDWLTPFGWTNRNVYWPANYEGRVYSQVTPAQLKRWSTLRSPGRWGSPPPDGPTVFAQDGRQVGYAAQVIVDSSGLDLQCVRFQADGTLWPERLTEVGPTWVAKHDRWHVQLMFDFETIRALITDGYPPAPSLPAGGRLERELRRQLRGDSLYAVDPYDVLAERSETGFETPIERDEASIINPQPRP